MPTLVIADKTKSDQIEKLIFHTVKLPSSVDLDKTKSDQKIEKLTPWLFGPLNWSFLYLSFSCSFSTYNEIANFDYYRHNKI